MLSIDTAAAPATIDPKIIAVAVAPICCCCKFEIWAKKSNPSFSSKAAISNAKVTMAEPGVAATPSNPEKYPEIIEIIKPKINIYTKQVTINENDHVCGNPN